MEYMMAFLMSTILYIGYGLIEIYLEGSDL